MTSIRRIMTDDHVQPFTHADRSSVADPAVTGAAVSERVATLSVAVSILALIREGKLTQKSGIPNFSGDPNSDPYAALNAICIAIEERVLKKTNHKARW